MEIELTSEKSKYEKDYENTINYRVAQRLKYFIYLKKKNDNTLSIKEIAEKANVQRVYIHKLIPRKKLEYPNETPRITLFTLEQILNALDVSLYDFFNHSSFGKKEKKSKM